MTSLELQLQGYRLTTAEILYHLPDHPSLLQSFVWQGLDISPKFPILHRFLEFWEHSIEGKINSVKFCSVGVVTPGEIRAARIVGRLH